MVKNERFEPHPVSGLVEIDWQNEVHIQYKRIDEETLQSLVTLTDLGLAVKLVYCDNDEAGGEDGWRIGEVLIVDQASSSWGESTVSAAEAAVLTTTRPPNGKLPTPDLEEDEDDDYWAQYDNTPAQTPGPTETRQPPKPTVAKTLDGATDEDSYYAQYSSVQPALDNHDPDEAEQNGEVESSLGKDEITTELQTHLSHPDLHNTSAAWSDNSTTLHESVAQPRPTSSHGSSGSDTVARLEKAAAEEHAGRESSELGIKQHIGTSIKSLWRLARVVGMEREEFERVVKTELEVLAMMDEDSN